MARIRTIKPEFWVDDIMVDQEPVTKLLYIGLWNFVDDEGYIEDSVRRIKMMVFPGNDYDVSEALRSLLECSRIIRMTSDQGPVLWIPHFTDHQRISHPTPTKFTGIQSPSTAGVPESSGAFAKNAESSALKGKEGKGKEGKGVPDEIRPDVLALCKILADMIEANGSKRPSVGRGWTEAARLMLDRDNRPYDEAAALVAWAQTDSFWKPNIQSMPKFRDKYDTLRLQRENQKPAEKPKLDPNAWMNAPRAVRG